MAIQEQWCSGAAECLSCGKEWVAVWPLGADELECPACGCNDTVRNSQDEAEG